MLSHLDDELLLQMLDDERALFSKADRAWMVRLVDEVIAREIYPRRTPDNPNNVMTMVDGWGARWHIWREPHACWNCKADLRNHHDGPPFKREVFVKELDANGRTTSGSLRCPDCNAPVV